MPDLSEEKFMLLYGEIKAVRQDLTNLKDERIQQMQNDISSIKVKMAIIALVGGLLVAGVIKMFLTQWQILTAPH